MGRRTAAGYTLAELLVTLAVAAILAAIAAPSFGEAYRQQQLSGRITDLANAHRLARGEAAGRGREVSVCKSADALSPTPSCGDDTVAWEDGWVVFQNSDRDSPAAIDPGEPILRVAPRLGPTLTLRGSAPIAASVSYRPTGDVRAAGTLVLCESASLGHARALFIGTTGRIRMAERDANGTPLDEDGTAIDSCEPT